MTSTGGRWMLAAVTTLLAVTMVAVGPGVALAQDGDRTYRVAIEHTETGIAYIEDWRLLLRADGTVAALAFEDTDNQLSDEMRFFRAIARLEGTHDGTAFQAQGSAVGMATLWAAEDSPGGVRLVECPIVEATVRWDGTVTDNAATINHTSSWDYRCIEDVGSAALDPAVAYLPGLSLPRVDALPDDEFAFAPSTATGATLSGESAPAESSADGATGTPTSGGFGSAQAGGETSNVATDQAATDATAGSGTGLLVLAGLVAVALTAVGIVIAIRLARGATPAGVGGSVATGSPLATPQSGSRRRIVLLLAGVALWTLTVGGVVALAGGTAAFAHYLAMLAFVVFVGATVSTARAFRRSRSMSRRALLVMALLPLVMALLQIGLNSQGRAVATLVGLPLGATAGVAWALLTKVEADDEGLKIAGTVPALILWAALIGVAQIVRLAGSDVSGLLLTIVVAQSTAFGVWALVVLRRGTRAAAEHATAPDAATPALIGASGKEQA